MLSRPVIRGLAGADDTDMAVCAGWLPSIAVRTVHGKQTPTEPMDMYIVSSKR